MWNAVKGEWLLLNVGIVPCFRAAQGILCAKKPVASLFPAGIVVNANVE